MDHQGTPSGLTSLPGAWDCWHVGLDLKPFKAETLSFVLHFLVVHLPKVYDAPHMWEEESPDCLRSQNDIFVTRGTSIFRVIWCRKFPDCMEQTSSFVQYLKHFYKPIYLAGFHHWCMILTFAWSEKHLRFLVYGSVLVLRLIVKLNLMQAREQYTPSLWGVTTYGNVYQSISYTEESLLK